MGRRVIPFVFMDVSLDEVSCNHSHDKNRFYSVSLNMLNLSINLIDVLFLILFY